VVRILEAFRLEGEAVVRASTGAEVVFRPGKRGYCTVRLGRRGEGSMEYHRVKFVLVNGYLPPRVDHADRDRSNNRKGNLRAATPAQNVQNSSAHRDSAAGLKGVSRHGSGWRAQIFTDGRKRHLGTYRTPEEASAAYQSAARAAHGAFFMEPPSGNPRQAHLPDLAVRQGRPPVVE
jgi:hypothetical protein